MRKNFTQLFLGLALIVGFATMGYSQCEIDPPPGAYYNFQFDGGTEGWTAEDAGGFPTTDGWAWNATGDVSMGAYGPAEGTTLGSESECNGAMVMDSDFLDNNGVQGAFETGPCPSPCNGILVSPPMDFSNATTDIDLIFFQAVRQFTSEYYIYTSLDGGATNFDTTQYNQDLVINEPATRRMMRFPMCHFQGESNVVIKFHYVGNYYFNALDDISLVESSDDVDMRVNENFYTKVANYATPRNMGTTVPILADIENFTAFESPESVLNFRVRDPSNQEIFSASLPYTTVAKCSTDENKLFDASYTMPNRNGLYTLEFEIDAEGDVNPDNDIVSAPFRMTEQEFRKLPTTEDHGTGFIGGSRFGGSFNSWGSYFQMPHNDHGQAIESITLGYLTNADDSIPSPGFINVGVYQWVDFDDNGTVDMGERLLLGQTDIIILGDAPPDSIITVVPLDISENLIVPDAGDEPMQLLVVAHTSPFDENTNYFYRGISEEDQYPYSGSATQFAHRLSNTIGGYGSFAAANASSHEDRHDRALFNVDNQVVWDISMRLSPPPPVGTEDINENISVNIYPSPATTKLNVELNLEEVSDKVSIELMDMAGNRAGIYNFSNIKKDNLAIDVSELPGGMYLVNIRTEAGMTSKKVTVVR